MALHMLRFACGQAQGSLQLFSLPLPVVCMRPMDWYKLYIHVITYAQVNNIFPSGFIAK